jgi:hypothetical protein
MRCQLQGILREGEDEQCVEEMVGADWGLKEHQEAAGGRPYHL